MKQLNNITVYCGSNLGNIADYYHAAQNMAKTLARRGHRIVYGGGSVGLMGTLADTALAHGAEVIGVVPHFLAEKEIAHDNLTTLIKTNTMSERKLKMIELADGYIAMAGGLGTYEELFEVLSNAQLELDQSPIGLLNTNGFYDPIMALLAHTAEQGFMPKDNLKLVCVSDDPDDLLDQMYAYTPTKAIKWSMPTWYQQILNAQSS